MKVRVPKRIRIGSYNYKVEYCEHMKNDEGWRAALHQRKALIQIDPDGGDTINRSFLHEIVHMIVFNYEFELSEADTSRIANGVAELLFDNLGIEFDWVDIE